MSVLDYLPSIAAFSAAIVGLVGRAKWDAAGKGRRKVTPAGRLTLVIAGLALLASWAMIWRSQVAADHGSRPPLRDRVVPPPPQDDVAQGARLVPASAPCAHPPTVPPTATRKSTAHRRHRYSWAELLRRVFHIEVFLCDCGGQRRLLAAILDPEPIRRILLHLGLPADPPPVAPARPPPAVALPWA